MNEQITRQAGSALIWKTIQLGGVKLIFLVRTLVLARLLLPEDFGLLAISMIAVDFLLSITNFGLIPALVQRPEVDRQHYDTAWSIGLSRAAGITAVVFLAAPLIAALFTEPQATPLIRAIAFRPLLEAMVSIRVAELVRDFRFRTLAFIYLPEALVNTILAVVLAPIWGVWALVAGVLAGPLAQIVMSYLLAPHRPRWVIDAAAARSLVRFGRWIFLTSLIAVSGSALVQLAVSRRLGTAELGLYFLAAKLAFLPAEVSGEVVGAVAFPLFARLQNNTRQIVNAFQAIFTSLFALLFPVCALIIALSPSLIEHVLGPQWAGTVPLIRLLALVNVLGLFGDTVIPVLKGMGQPDKQTIVEVVQSALLIGFIWSLTAWFGVAGAALAWLAAVGSSQLLSAIFLTWLLTKPLAGLGGPLLAITAVSLSGGLLALGIDHVLPGLAGLAAAVAGGMVVMGLLFWQADQRFTLGLRDNIGHLFPQLIFFRRLKMAARS